MEIYGDLWVTLAIAEHSLRNPTATIASSLSAHCAINGDQLRSHERPAATNGNHWLTKRMHQRCCRQIACWEIIERLVRPLSARWEIAEHSLKTCFHWRPLRVCRTSSKFDGDNAWRHGDHKGRPWRLLSAYWKTVERSVKFCGRSVVSQWSRLCGKIPHIVRSRVSVNGCFPTCPRSTYTFQQGFCHVVLLYTSYCVQLVKG